MTSLPYFDLIVDSGAEFNNEQIIERTNSNYALFDLRNMGSFVCLTNS